MLDRDIQAIADPVERFCKQVEKLKGGVSTRVTAMLLGQPFHYGRLNPHIAETREAFVKQVAALDYTDEDYGVTDAMNVVVSWEPDITLRDLLLDALIKVNGTAVYPINPDAVYVIPGRKVSGAWLNNHFANRLVRGSSPQPEKIDVTLSTDTQTRTIDKLDDLLLPMDKIPTNAIIAELQRRLGDEGINKMSRWATPPAAALTTFRNDAIVAELQRRLEVINDGSNKMS